MFLVFIHKSAKACIKYVFTASRIIPNSLPNSCVPIEAHVANTLHVECQVHVNFCPFPKSHFLNNVVNFPSISMVTFPLITSHSPNEFHIKNSKA